MLSVGNLASVLKLPYDNARMDTDSVGESLNLERRVEGPDTRYEVASVLRSLGTFQHLRRDQAQL